MQVNMETDQDKTSRDTLDRVTEQIIGCAFTVINRLGSGFLEKVYENALAHELRKAGLKVEQQYAVKVHYDGVVVGNYVADLLVAGCVLVELKAIKSLGNVETAQCLNYLKATGMRVCLLLNFARPRVQVKRIVHNF